MPTLTKLIATFLVRFGANGKPREAQPARDWLFMLLATFVCVLGGAGYGLYSFVSLGQAVAPGTVGSVGTSVALDRAALQDTVARYRERTVRFEELRHIRSDIPQPGGAAARSQETPTQVTTSTQSELVPNP